MVRQVVWCVLAAVLSLSAPAWAQAVTAAKHAAAAPDEIAAPVRALLAPGGATVKVGDATLEFWWVKSLPMTAADWSGVAEGTLVGALRVSVPFKDIRGRTLKPGAYLLRYGLQPQNGDHLGVSPYREFLLATAAAEDKSPEPLGHDGVAELSAKAINISHPAVFSLDPPVATAAPLAVTQNEAGHTAVTFEVTTSKGPLKFGLILVGHIEA